MKLSVNSNLSGNSFSQRRKGKLSSLFSRFRPQSRPGTPASRAFGKNTANGRKLWRTVGLVSGVVVGIVLLATVVGGIVLASYLGKISAALPDPGNLPQRTLQESTQIFDRNGKELYTVYGDYNREFVTLDKIPEQVKWSVMAAEDIDFYNHKGVDVTGILAAIVGKLRGQQLRGASTIDQQLTRNTVLVDLLGDQAYDVNLSRKVKELLITMKLDQQLTKDQILELYLNLIPLGGPNYGFQAAAKAYFNKDVSDLTLAESAFLAGIIRSPTGLSPLTGGDPQLAQERRDQVLDLMHKYKDRISITVKDPATGKTSIRAITDEDIQAAKDTPLELNPGKIDIQAPHFVFYVIQQLEEKYGVEAVKTGGLHVTTSLDLDMQRVAEDEVKKDIKNFRKWYGTNNAALVAINPKNGEVLAMVGSADYNNTKDKRVDGNVNIAITPRQQGSAVKSTTYLESFARGYNPGTMVPDIEMSFGNYKPLDWDKKYQGPMSIRRALSASRNVPAVYTLQMIGGTEVFLDTAKKVGITGLNTPDRYGLSVTLGAAEMRLLDHTNVYAMHANRGEQYPATSILEIKDNKGNKIYKYEPEKEKKRVYSEQEVYLLNWINCLIGTSADKLSPWAYSVPGQRLCGKTGTTDGPTDLTSFLYYPRLVVGVWAGNNNNDFTFGTRGQGWSTNVPITINHNYISRVYKRMGSEWYTQPSGIIAGQVCKDTGLLANKSTDCPRESTVFISGHVPQADNAHKKLAICKSTGKIATNESDARALNLIEDRLYLDFQLQNAAQQGAWNKWWTKAHKGFLFKDAPDTADCPLGLGPNNEPSVTVGGQSVVVGQNFTVSAAIGALDGVKQVVFNFNGTPKTVTAAPWQATFTAPASGGSYPVTVTATDNSNRVGMGTATITVTAANITTTISGPAGGGNQALATASGPNAGLVNNYIFSIDGQPYAIGTKASATTWLSNAVAPGAHTVYAVPRDVNNVQLTGPIGPVTITVP